MPFRLALLGMGVTCALLAGASAQAQTATDTFNVLITIEAECQVNSTTDMDFGSSGVIDTEIEQTSTITVECSNGLPFDIGLDAGQGTGATVETRLMTGSGGETVEYSLYQDAARTTVWGNTIDTDAVADTGTGDPQEFQVYGLVPVQPTPTAGDYSDTVTVTVTF